MEKIKTSLDELLHLAEQERQSRCMMRDDDYGEIRASIVREWALRCAAERLDQQNTMEGK